MPDPAPRLLRESDVSAAAGCLHRWYLECHGAGRADEARDPADDFFKRHCVSWLPDLREPAWDGRDPAAGGRETARLMAQGPAWIFRGILAAEGMLGRPDLLRRMERPSALGAFSYVPAALKRRSTPVESSDVRELQFHALLLEPLLGERPSSGWVYRPDGSAEEIDLRATRPAFETLIADLERIRRGDLRTEGYRWTGCRRCPWRQHCTTVWTQLSHVCLLPGMDTADVGAFRDGGYASWRAVAAATPELLAQRVGLPLPLARFLWLHAKAFQSRRPLVIQPAPFPRDLPVHFYAPEFRYGRCYLHGDLRVEGGEIRVRQFLASSTAQEGAAWHALLDHLARDPRALVFSWTDRLDTPLEALWNRHGGNPRGWRHLSRGRRSLHRFLREQVILPLSDYGLREVGSYFSVKWSARSPAAGIFPSPWEREQAFPDITSTRTILDANRERIEAMKTIYFALQRMQEFGCAA
ncbi:MAG TPA: TM0106 family RecB-like putative nuclease [Planctomycetota bacterium]|nr:TM0106 family RecB-like putative nuclease [Planctomycetota bacterium]